MKGGFPILLLGAALTAGCSADGSQQARFGGGLGGMALRLFDTGQPPVASAPFQALLATPTPAIVVSVEDRQAVGGFLRQSVRDGIETWISPDNVALYLEAGFLVGTRGLGADMMSADIRQTSALILGRRNGQAERFISFLDGNDQATVRSYICDIEGRGSREIDLGTGPVQTELVQERCANPDQSFQNLYWVDPGSGEIVQSRQWAGAFAGPLAIRRALR